MFSANATQVSDSQAYVDNYFATVLYTGTGANQTITTGINLLNSSGFFGNNDGLVWIKNRDNAVSHFLCYYNASGTARGVASDDTAGQVQSTDVFFGNFSATGFTLKANATGPDVNKSGSTYAAHVIKFSQNFATRINWVGNQSNRSISHFLGAAPDMVIVKAISGTFATSDWVVWHRDAGLLGTQYLELNTNLGIQTDASNVFGTAGNFTSSSFPLGVSTVANGSGTTYEAWLFADNTAPDGMIRCGSFTTDASGNASVTALGWEPQFLLVKASSTTGDWIMLDSMRGWSMTTDASLLANSTAAESTATGYGNPTATGFDFAGGAASATYIYMAIRRPNKPPTSGSQVFAPLAQTGTGSATTMNLGIVTDWLWSRLRAATGSVCGPLTWDRMRGPLLELNTSTTSAESSRADSVLGFDAMNGVRVGTTYPNSASSAINYAFKRAPGFFDVVCYTGDGTDGRNIAHSLGTTPGFVLIKRTDSASQWAAYSHAGTYNGMSINNTAAPGINGVSRVTATTFQVCATGNSGIVGINPGVDYERMNINGGTYVAYLFASFPGISKVGVYTGNGSSQTINCGFTTGARFVLIKRTNGTGNWYFWDTARGIVAANDPWLTTNDTTIAEQTADDSVDPDSTGFVVNQNATTNINFAGATYLYLAIA